MANIVATARIGARVIRVIGESGWATKREMRGQLDLFLAHVATQQASKATTVSRCQAGLTLDL